MVSKVHQAVIKNDFITVKTLVNHDSEVVNLIALADGQKGVTPIQIAARRGQTEMIALLYGLNADLEIQDEEHRCTALGWAAYFGQVEAVDLLILLGANVNDACNPLKLAMNQGYPKVVDILKRCGARDLA
jgi:ankyrin repeat protein